MDNEIKKLYKSKENKVVSGVIGGIGEYFELDPVILRLVYSVVVLFTGLFPGLVVYIIASLIIPVKNGDQPVKSEKSS